MTAVLVPLLPRDGIPNSNEPQDGKAAPQTVEDFRLPDQNGRSYRLYRYKDAKAVVLFSTGTGCPIVRQSVPELKRLRDQYAPQGVVFLLLDPNPADDRASIQKEASEFGIDLPILRDEVQVVARMLEFRRTAEALLLNPKDWSVIYRGSLDDRFDYGTAQPEARQHWLQDVLDAFLNSKPVAKACSETKGCLIDIEAWPKEVSYAEKVAPILAAKCVHCHSEGNVAPFAFSSYHQAKKWAPMMREVVLTQRMPPWHADRDFGRFANDRSLSVEETRTLLAWVAAGAQRGDGGDPLAEAKPAPRPEWAIGTPDRVVSLDHEVELPAQGVFDYQYSYAPAGVSEDTWVRAVDVEPTNRKVVHHALVFIVYPIPLRHLQPDVRQGLEGYFAAYIPGQDPVPFPEGTAKFVPKGSYFLFQMHYTATGKPEKDRTRLALYFAKDRPKHEIETHAAYTTSLEIPPGAADYTATASHRLAQDVTLWALSPHMHYRGSWFEYEAQYPDGKKELLLSVPHYDFAWQTLYRLREPKRLPAGTTIVCRGGFDNSARNSANPDPRKSVYFGNQTWDEMFIGYMEYSPLKEAAPPVQADARSPGS